MQVVFKLHPSSTDLNWSENIIEITGVYVHFHAYHCIVTKAHGSVGLVEYTVHSYIGIHVRPRDTCTLMLQTTGKEM